jgi:hypothetical protein
MKWLKTKVRARCLLEGYVTVDPVRLIQGYDAIGAVDGRDGVRVFEAEGRFECVFDKPVVSSY